MLGGAVEITLVTTHALPATLIHVAPRSRCTTIDPVMPSKVSRIVAPDPVTTDATMGVASSMETSHSASVRCRRATVTRPRP